MIPKIIHQTWKTKYIPDKWKDAVESCKKTNRDYKHVLWTHETMDKFIKNYFSDFYKTYRSYKYDIQRCDAFRYFVLYKYGGIYLDMDTVCNVKLDTFLKNDIVLARSSNVETSFTNAFIMVVPKNPFIKYCMDRLSENVNNYQSLGKHLHVMYSAGPGFLTNMANEYGKIKGSYILTKEEYAGDCNACSETCNGGKYFTHLQGKTWNEMDSHIYNFLLCNRKNIIGGILIGSGIFVLL